MLFSTSAAAQAYWDNLKHLQRLNQKHTPQTPLDKGIPQNIGEDGEDVGDAVRNFTLLPNAQKSFGVRILSEPYSPALKRIVEKGAYHNLLMQERDKVGENLVLFYVDQGTINLRMVQKLIGEDGRRRNLNWALEGHKDGDVVAFGVGRNGKTKVGPPHQEDELEEDGEEGEGDGHGEPERRRKNPGVPPRYIIRLKDAAEARRFVRSWHTRVLEGEPWDTLGVSGKWAGGMVNAEILW